MSFDGADPVLEPESIPDVKPPLKDPSARMGRPRLTPERRTTLRRLGVLAFASVLVATVGFVASDSLTSRGSPDAVPSAGSPAAAALQSPTSSAPPPSFEPEEAWAAIEPPPLDPVAALVASDVDRTGIAASSRFTLTSLSATPAAVLAEGVTAVPAISFAIKPGKDAANAILVPKSPLAAGVSYRLTLRTSDAALAGSWLFQTESPLHVASTLPSDQATGVPVNTGIEITFDQDGVGPIAPFTSIEPKVNGRFEQHGRTWAFVPEQLHRATIYTVTVRKGVTLAGSDQVLEDNVSFSFETVGADKPASRSPLDASFPWKLIEVVPAERPLVEAYVDQPWDEGDTRKPLSSLDLRVFQVPSLSAAVDAYRTLTTAPDWAESSDQRLVPTAGLPLVASFTATIRTVAGNDDGDETHYVEFPDRLDRGWYLVVRPRNERDQQFLLQVTDVATYVTTTTTRSVLWVNDVSSGAPIEGATLWTANGKAIATTGPDGTAQPTIPVGDLFLVTARDGGSPGNATSGRAAIVPTRVDARSTDACSYWGWGWETETDDYWHVLATDRHLYRPTDEIDAWGMVRPRDGGGVPEGVELRVSTERWDCDETPAQNRALAIARIEVAPGGRTGTFAAPIAVRDLPAGPYLVELWAGATRVAYRSFEVGEIRKPSYAIDVSPDRHVLVEGDRFKATVTSAFFDGTPVPGLELRLNGTDTSGGATTSDFGEATLNLVASWRSDYRQGHDWRDVSVSSVLPEEADIRTESTGYVVFPARLLLDGTAEVVGGDVHIVGDAHILNQAAAERQWIASAGSDWDPEGEAAAGVAIHVRIVDRWYVPVQTGRRYDFISKRAYDTFRYDRKERIIAETDVVSGSGGMFALDVARAMGDDIAPKGHDYDVTLSARDADGRGVSASVYGYASWNDLPHDWDQNRALKFADDSESSLALGAEVRRSLIWRGAPAPSGHGNRYLFLTASRGLRDVSVSSSPVFVHRFAETDLPNLSIGAVWFTGRGYVIAAGTRAEIDLATRELNVTLTPDSARHAPGDPVRLGVRIVDRDGKPVTATVILRAIDEKLYAIRAAWEETPLEELYSWVPSGIITTYSSHRLPTGRSSEGGDTSGGGDGDLQAVRDQFRDSVLFERVTTGADGRASVTFTLSDDITSWRVSGAAFTPDLRVGQATAAIAVGLPLFIEAPVAPEYLASDRPTLLLRAYGSALRDGQPVTFTVSAPTLGMLPTTVRGSAFAHVAVALPELVAGDHSIRIEASAASASGPVRDILVRTIHVVDSRFTQARSECVVLPAELPSTPATGMAKYVFADAGRGRYLWPVRALAWGGGERVDEALAAVIARDVLAEAFGFDEDASSGYPSYLYRYQKAPSAGQVGSGNGQGIALLPYGSPEVALSARVSLLAGERFQTWGLGEYFRAILADPAATREQKNLALAGLAGVDNAVAPDVLTALGDPGLTVRERLYLALAAATLGDHGAALAAERSLLKAYGQKLGPWVRLRVGSTENEVLEATSLLALIAVTTGDPVADAAEAYVEEHFTREDLYDLQKAAYLREAVDRAPAPSASFSFTIAGESSVIDLGPGETYALNLAPAQRATLSAKELKGRIGVTVEWDQPVDPASMAVDSSLSLTRTVLPASPIPSGSVVTVVLTPRFGELTITGCYRVVDLAPSGLAPLSWAWGGTHGSEDVTPWVISGQKVIFCTSPGSARPPRLVYFARVVTPGEYTWEPALMQAARGKESTALTAAERIVIR